MSELQDIKLQIGKNQKSEANNQITKIEESKSSKIANEESTAYPRLPCFHDQPSSQLTRYGMYVFKKDTYKVKGMEEWVVEGEWLEGKPHGVCIYEDEYERGVATFTRG